MIFFGKPKKQKNNKKIKKGKKFFALFLSTFLVIVFAAMQVLEITRGDYQTGSHTDSVTLTTTVAEVISLDCGADVNFGTLTPATPVTGSSTCTVTTNANGGYNLKVKRDNSDYTMKHSAFGTNGAYITDKTAWDPTGSGNAAVWGTTGLGFTLYSSTATKSTTWWGAGTTETDAANKYAGMPLAYANVMIHTAYSSGSTTNSIGYKLDVPTTQRSGVYSGSVTYQVTTTP